MRRLLVMAGLLAVLTGCSTVSSLNPFSAKVEPKNLPAPLVEFKPTVNVKNVWTVSVGKSGGYVFSPAHARDSVYAAAADGTVLRVSLADGSTIWRVSAGMPLTAGVGSDGNTVAVAGEKGMLLAFDAADGKLKWKTQVSSEVLSAPVVGGGLVVIRSLDNRIAAYEAQSGKRVWAVDRQSPPLTLRSAPGMVIVGPTVVVALPGGRLISLALPNGGLRWEMAVGDPRGTTELERIADVSGFPAVFGRDVCAVAYQGRVGCLDVVNGAGRWSRKLSSSVGLGIDDRNVYAADDGGAVYAFTRDGGQNVWRNDKLANRGLSSPVALGHILAVADYQGYVHFLSREDGAFVNRLPTDGSAVVAPPILAESRMIVQTKAGALFAFAGN